MAGAGLIEIKRRIKSVQSTRKITKAMGLVSTSKLRRARANLNLNETFFDTTLDITKDVFNEIDGFMDSVYLKGNGSKRKLYIVLASDTGLCGGYNVSLALRLREQVKTNGEEAEVICVGKKGVSYVKRYGFNCVGEYLDIQDHPNFKEMLPIYNHALRLYKDSEYGEINVVYTRFNSPVSQEVKIERLLPVKLEKENVGDYTIEPRDESAVEEVFDFYIVSKLLNSMLHARTSEQSLRMTAMDGATKNANDLLDRLESKYNRIRQSAITQEIAEIVGGAEAQK
ncbi:ATP synthase F1 subunit gamma [Clostridium sp. LY3-2]|uniref:ATP synthase F1 subunit gamma n=1 Tax=Clostridium sp. LY3-2 TaxID=2942482 RepID=UPI0021530F60|nr:ATP synthase F1 subunit gamma [Clostridium sp. LY3-2]MCR6516396.1 ATP synthase F1 subunit gamma [Clostridium sp. LY3-2]